MANEVNLQEDPALSYFGARDFACSGFNRQRHWVDLEKDSGFLYIEGIHYHDALQNPELEACHHHRLKYMRSRGG